MRRSIPELEGDRASLFRICHRSGQVADRPEVVGAAAQDPAEASPIAETARQRFSVAKPQKAFLEPSKLQKRLLLVEDRVDDPLRALPLLGKVTEARQSCI